MPFYLNGYKINVIIIISITIITIPGEAEFWRLYVPEDLLVWSFMNSYETELKFFSLWTVRQTCSSCFVLWASVVDEKRCILKSWVGAVGHWDLWISVCSIMERATYAIGQIWTIYDRLLAFYLFRDLWDSKYLHEFLIPDF